MQIEVTRRANWWPLGLMIVNCAILILCAAGILQGVVIEAMLFSALAIFASANEWAKAAYRTGAEDGLAVAADLQRREEPGCPRRKLRGECDRRVTSIAHTNGMREVVALRIEVE